MKPALVALFLVATPAFAEKEVLDFDPEPPAAAAIIAAARAECLAETDNATVLYDPELAITYTDFLGDQARDANGDFNDMVIDFNYLTCQWGNVWAGTGGAPVHFIIDGETSESWNGFGWQLVRFNAYTPVVILLGRHGTYCDDFGARTCIQAIAVDEDGFSYVRDTGPNVAE